MINQSTYINILIVILLLFFLPAENNYGQFYKTGQDPASIKWKQIETKHFQIVFSEEITDQANRFANLLEHVYQIGGKTLEHEPRKISVLLHNHNVVPNGFVVWAPKRLEAYTIPPQDSDPVEWFHQLAVHEFRHVVQMDKLNQGITRIAYFILGEQAVGAVSGLLPLWFYEGDAVCTETALTRSGRGRLPSFEKELRAMMLEKSYLYSYEKATFGSYRDHVPDHYQYGYHLTAYGRKKYGSTIWSDIVNYVGRTPILPAPSYWAFQKHMGMSKAGFYTETFFKIKKEWEKQDNKIEVTDYHQWNVRNNQTYTNYKYARYVNDTSVIVEKSGIDQLNEFVILSKSGTEQKIYTPGLYLTPRLSYTNDKVIWGAYIPDIRWEKRNYYIIKQLDLGSGKVKCLTRKTRYFSPALSRDGKYIATVHISLKNEYQLFLLNAHNADVLQKISPPGQHFIQTPRWNEAGSQIVMTMIDENGKSLIRYNTNSKQWDTLLPPSHVNITEPVFYKDFICFQADYSGIDNIYAIHTKTRKIYRVTSSRYGAYHPDINTNTKEMVYSDYTSRGYNIVTVKLNSSSWEPLDSVENHSMKLYKHIVEQEDTVLNAKDISWQQYTSKPYSKFLHLFNIHSWSPFYFNYEQTDLSNDNMQSKGIGVNVLSQNLLGSMVASMGYEYKNEAWYYYPKLEYSGWFPKFSFSGQFHEPIVYERNPAFQMDYNNINFQATLPLQLTRNRFIRTIRAFSKMEYEQSNFYVQNRNFSTYENIMLQHTIEGNNLLMRSKRDILPRFGQNLQVSYVHDVFDIRGEYARMFAVKSNLYFPGILKHHTIQLSAAYQDNLEDNYLSFYRAHTGQSYKIYADNLWLGNGRYVFPIAYPDFTPFSAFYLKRIRGNFFYDYTLANDAYAYFNQIETALPNEMYTTGATILFDFHLFHFVFPVTSGFRYYYQSEMDAFYTDFVFNIGLNSF